MAGFHPHIGGPSPGHDLPDENTRPTRPPISYATLPPIRRRRRWPRGCLSVLLAGVILTLIYLFLPVRTHVLILGTDSREAGNPLGRTDTMILAGINPLRPDVVLLSVPRDLWVEIPGYGENRINAAFFFAEADRPGSGPQGAIEVVRSSFNVAMDYYLLVDFQGIVNLVDAMGGIDLDLPEPMSGYDAGIQHLDGTQALAFVRDREGSDDFFRMARGQLFVRAAVAAFLKPSTWLHLPGIALALPGTFQTDIPPWQWPRLALASLRAGPDGITGAIIDRDLVTPFTTAAGASVLLPNWERILPLVKELFP